MSIMQKSGYSVVDDEHNADVIFLNTCAIRENAGTQRKDEETNSSQPSFFEVEETNPSAIVFKS